LSFQGIHGQHLAIEYSPPNCLRIMGADDQLISEYQDRKGASRGGLGLDLIDLNANKTYRLPESIYRRSNQKSWCYYFQKASLARQMEDWELIIQYGDEARDKGLRPIDATEWRPFIDAYNRLDRKDDAEYLESLH